jgi:hypothetical protein
VLSFNASDPSGAGGLAGDVATIAAMGAHCLPVVTAVVLRDTAEVFEHENLDADTAEQARHILEDVPITAWKVGFLGSAEAVSAVAEVLSDYPDCPVTYLPSVPGRGRAADSYLDALRELVLPQTAVLVGNHKTLTDFLLPDWDSERAVGARAGRGRRQAAPACAGDRHPAAQPVHGQRAGLAQGRSPARSSSASRPPSSAPATRCRPRWRRCWRWVPSCTRPSARPCPSWTRRWTRASAPAWATSFPTASSGPCPGRRGRRRAARFEPTPNRAAAQTPRRCTDSRTFLPWPAIPASNAPRASSPAA